MRRAGESLDPELLQQLDREKLPDHVAIIMDGNGRWAQSRSLPRVAGHRAGIDSVDEAVTTCRELGIKALTLYSFSVENWRRPQAEVDVLMAILKEYIYKELDRMKRERIRFNVIGHVNDLPQPVQEAIRHAIEETRGNEAMVLTLALSYSSRMEILNAVKQIGQALLEGSLSLEEVDESLFERHLYTADLPGLDLLIRTSGEMRVSNFLLWQMAYTELYFIQVLWPDFRADDLLRALLEFQKRERRFGLISQQLPTGLCKGS
ncbi:MAG: isoprenyl transferase [Candidatus Tectomicrobia bacterium]|uniref:Isoprenyl transferase n=1 Tax=Tectimicrobiota bacterium TaxID=2528274 RepID=A0A932CQY6_UNCTE|nr:isoprenyl transferase [Candidatus Tectomicrobia bacterium]